MIWEEAVVNALYRGERPSFPSHIPFKPVMEPLIHRVVTPCWADNPFDRPTLSFIEVCFLRFVCIYDIPPC